MTEAKKATKAKRGTAKEKKVKEPEASAEAVAATKEKAEEKLKTTAKAGKRSSKAIAEAEEKQAKKERKAQKKSEEVAEVKKQQQKLPRTKLERAGKKYREASKLIKKNNIYSIEDGLELATKTSTTKFDATVELHINLGVDSRQADQNVRGIVVLPSGTGKSSRVAVLADNEDDKKAKAAGADLVGADQILANLDKEKIEFDVLVATPVMMPKLAKYARVLGPKGLMPNPKSGTVTTDVAKAVQEAKAGRVEYRVDSAGIVHLGIGKVSFGKEKLTANAKAVTDAIKASKPASLKSIYVRSSHISTTMGPSIKIQIA